MRIFLYIANIKRTGTCKNNSKNGSTSSSSAKNDPELKPTALATRERERNFFLHFIPLHHGNGVEKKKNSMSIALDWLAGCLGFSRIKFVVYSRYIVQKIGSHE